MKKIYRSDNAIVSGVAGGVSEYLEVDPVIIRLVGVAIFLGSGFVPFALMYLLAAIVIPKR